ncbi:MAG: outer membrane cobalamin receptor [Sphingobacteriales bacterium]|jgi:outer membrane cobalamin receptor
MKIGLSILVLLLSGLVLQAQEKYTISGEILDLSNGESLIGASVRIAGTGTGTIANAYGYYSLSLPQGNYELVYGYIGYADQVKKIVLDKDQTLSIELGQQAIEIDAVEIVGKSARDNVESVKMSVNDMSIETIKSLPALMGEVDIIKAIQLLPGVQTVGEGNSGFFVRGGAADQNLVLLDEAQVFNASHLLGFFSVFNPDAIQGLELYKGGIPARYGGRLSSVLDIRMSEGNSKKWEALGGIGTISSRLTVKGPIKKDKGSILVSGRRTYADVFLKLSPNEDLKNNTLYFYDLNVKANYRIDENNKLFISGYFGRDVFKFGDFASTSWGNTTLTARWNHLFSKRLFSNTTLILSDFDYELGATQDVLEFVWNSSISNYGIKNDYSYFLSPQNTIRFGFQSTIYDFQTGSITVLEEDSSDVNFDLPVTKGWENGIYIENERDFGSRLTVNYGLRLSSFSNFGPATVYSYDPDFELKDTLTYDKGEFYKTYFGLEPRVGLRYTLNEESSIKMSYNRTNQYIQQATNATSSSPLDVWFPSSPNVKPQLSDQIAAGYFRNFQEGKLEASAEVYYKWGSQAIDFKNHAQLLLNPYLEGELRAGITRAYGLELFLKKTVGDFTGWLSYTLSKSERQVLAIQKDWFPNAYDKRHDISLVGSYAFSERKSFGLIFVYGSGAPITSPTGRFNYRGVVVPVYSDRNSARMPAYHRLDASYSIKSKKGRGQWVFSCYNIYGRKNPYLINFKQREATNETYAEMVYLFRFVPAVTYNFKF